MTIELKLLAFAAVCFALMLFLKNKEYPFFGLVLSGLAGVYFSVISFPLFMLLILLLTGGVWLIDSLFYKKARVSGAADPTLLEYAKSFFPIILVVFTIRSFLVEPFKIPSASMMPTLIAGDYILVNKYKYGIRLPIINNTVFEVGSPQRGDVFVFHYPVDPKIDFIKRVIGLPGDKIQYQDKVLTINGQKQENGFLDNFDYATDGANIAQTHRHKEQLGNVAHDILVMEGNNQYDPDMLGAKLANGETVIVPAGHYFGMGDNRDNSSDSRVWGFVPEQNLVGKAFFIWFNFSEMGRIGNKVQ